MINQLLNILDTNPDFRCFTFDGQTIVLEDYLEIYPENEEKIRQYIKEGRISIGPWYVIPDEFLPSGEALIRNLLMGDEICRKFGNKLMCGYLPDNFGHTSQLPQMLNNFHIDNALFYRGIDREVTGNKSEFIWESPDGSRVLGIHLAHGYWNFKSWGYIGMDTIEHFKKTWDTLRDYTETRCYLLLNGSDHLYPQHDLTEKIEEIRKKFPDIKIINSSIEDYIDAVKEELKPERLNIVQGELRYGKDAPVYQSVGSSRTYVKQFNHKCEAELEKYTEPLNALVYTLGEQYPQNLIGQSWKELLRNHPHDSICACSLDEVMEDVMMRFKHSHQISGHLSEDAFRKLVSRVSADDLEEGSKALVVYNPLSWEKMDIIEAVISFPEKEDVKDIKIFDSENQEIPYEIIDISEEIRTVEFKYNSKEKHRKRNFRVRFIAENIPALGYRRYKVKPLKLKDKMRYQQYLINRNFGQTIENEFYSICPDADGTITIYDKKNNYTYPKMNLLLDRGDSGDEYSFEAPLKDEVIFPVLKGVSIISNTPIQSTLKMELELNIPKSLDRKYFTRVEERASCPVVTYVTLHKGIDRIDFKTVIENNAADHALYVKFQTDIKGDYDYGHGSFDVIKRKVDIDPVREGDNEILTPFKPMHLYMNVFDDEKALTLISRGLYEYQVKRSEDGLDVLLTLMRSVRWMFRETLSVSRDGQPCTTPVVYTPDAQCKGTQIFEYSLVMHRSDSITDKTYRQAYDFNYPLRAAQTDKSDNGDLPVVKSWLNISDSRIIVSAFKKCDRDEAVVLRLYNISDQTVDFKIEIGFPAKKVYLSNMPEENIEELKVENNQIHLCAKKREIITLKLYL